MVRPKVSSIHEGVRLESVSGEEMEDVPFDLLDGIRIPLQLARQSPRDANSACVLLPHIY